MPISPDEDTLDQALTTAGYAMAFAISNWQAFRQFTETMIARPMPIDQMDMNRHAMRLIRLADPERMPGG